MFQMHGMFVFSSLLDWLEGVFAGILSFLPDSPFRLITNDAVAEYMGYINWIIPIAEIIAIMQLWITAIGIFYLYRAILKWVGKVS
jgi:hypothetical protein